MKPAAPERTISVAFANGADVLSWKVNLGPSDDTSVTRMLFMLQSLGHVAAFHIGSAPASDLTSFVDALRHRVGDAVLHVWRDDDPYRSEPPPAFLMPVWPFDHEVQGRLASTGRLLGLDFQLTATPTFDQEVGAHLPGRDGLWLIHAKPLG